MCGSACFCTQLKQPEFLSGVLSSSCNQCWQTLWKLQSSINIEINQQIFHHKPEISFQIKITHFCSNGVKSLKSQKDKKKPKKNKNKFIFIKLWNLSAQGQNDCFQHRGGSFFYYQWIIYQRWCKITSVPVRVRVWLVSSLVPGTTGHRCRTECLNRCSSLMNL